MIRDLEDLKDPETGERIITEIHTREEVFPGSAIDDAPDLQLVLRDFGFVSVRNLHPVVQPRDYVIGTHHPDGVFLAYGPGIEAGKMLGRRHITDVTSTLLYSLGLPIPSDLEGKVPTAMFTADYQAKHPLKIGEATQGGGKDERGETMDEEERQQLMDQLQMLGYME